MVTLTVLNLIFQAVDAFISRFFSPFGDFLANIGSKLSLLTVPSTVYDFVSILVYFLPMGTILVMFNITMFLIAFGLVLAFIHFVVHLLDVV